VQGLQARVVRVQAGPAVQAVQHQAEAGSRGKAHGVLPAGQVAGNYPPGPEALYRAGGQGMGMQHGYGA